MFKFLRKTLLTVLFVAFASQASAMFIQPDWLDPTMQGVGTNRYSYSFNDPINNMDPGGNQCVGGYCGPTDLSGWFEQGFGGGPIPGYQNNAQAVTKSLGKTIEDTTLTGLSLVPGAGAVASIAMGDDPAIAIGMELTGPAGDALKLGGKIASPLIKGALRGGETIYGPMNKGPLPESIANTFRSGTYKEVITTESTTLYRVIGDNGSVTGGYWSRTKPQGPLQSVIDLALDQNWGNTATRVVEMEVPVGTRIFEGVAAPQRGLTGGGNQVYFDKDLNPIDEDWIK
jgi:hypothetical protein